MSRLRSRRTLILLVLVAAPLAFFAQSGFAGPKLAAKTLIFAVPAVVTNLDGEKLYQGDQSRRAGYELQSTLVKYNASKLKQRGCNQLATIKDLSSDLAESWGWTKNRKAIVFRLKRGVKSEWGNELTAADVKWSLDRSLALSTIAKFFYYTVGKFETKDPVQIINNRTVQINLAQASNLDIVLHTSFLLQIYDSTEAKKHATSDDPWASNWLAKNTATFGPWSVRESDIDPGKQIVYHRNPNYRGKRGNITTFIERAIPDSSTRLQLLKAGEVDVIYRLSYDEVVDLHKASRSGQPVRARVCVAPQRDIIIPNHQFKPFSDVRVRRAVSLALDRRGLINSAYRGFARAARAGMSQSYAYPRAHVGTIAYNPSRAKELLAQAGYPNGFSFTLSVSPNRPGGYAPELAVLVKDQLARIGVNVNIRLVSGAADYSTIFSQGNYEALIWDMGPVVGEPAYELYLHNTCNGFQNSQKYCNPAYDDLAAKVAATPPGAARDKYLNAVDKLIQQEIPVIFIADVAYITGWRSGISYYEAIPSGELMAVNLVKK